MSFFWSQDEAGRLRITVSSSSAVQNQKIFFKLIVPGLKIVLLKLSVVPGVWLGALVPIYELAAKHRTFSRYPGTGKR